MDARRILFKIYWKIERIIAPDLLYSQRVYEEVLKSHVDCDFIWLDLGCGHQLLPLWRLTEEKKLVDNCQRIIGFDYDYTALKRHKSIYHKVTGDASRLPFMEESFDLVTANMVVEHFSDPEIALSEVQRVLKPEGLFIFHTPNLYGYTTLMAKLIPEKMKKRLIRLFQRRKEEDVFLTHYKLNSPSDIEKVAKLTGFNIQKIRMIVSSGQFVVIPPAVIIELLWIRMLMAKPLKRFRTNIIAILKKGLW